MTQGSRIYPAPFSVQRTGWYPRDLVRLLSFVVPLSDFSSPVPQRSRRHCSSWNEFAPRLQPPSRALCEQGPIGREIRRFFCSSISDTVDGAHHCQAIPNVCPPTHEGPLWRVHLCKRGEPH